MANPPMSDDLKRQAVEYVVRHGSVLAASIAEGVPESTIRHRIKQAKQLPDYEDPAITAAKIAIGTGLDPRLVWAKTKSDDGTSFSVLLRPAEMSPEDQIERIRGVLTSMKPAPQIAAPKHCDSDLLTLYPIADAHVGLLAWGKESGEDYNLEIAQARIAEWMRRCVAASPASKTAIILDTGDLMHVDDRTNQTPRNKHILDAASRYYRIFETSISAMQAAIDAAAEKHERVIVRILPGNHNPNSYIGIMFALAAWYRNTPRVEVQKVPGEFFAHQFGKVLIAAHHGDKAKAERMVHFVADEYAAMWGKTRHRYLWTGHLHHHKSADIGGVQWEQLRAITARDAHTVSNAYTARAQLQGITYHREHGEVQRVKVAA